MKLSLFKKLIRDIIREELDYKLIAVEKKLDEVLVSSNANIIKEVRSPALATTGYKNLINESPKAKSNDSVPNNNVAIPKTSNSILNSLLEETANSDEWKTVEGNGKEVQSVQDNTESLPNHLAEALTKDYSTMLDVVKKKDNFKRGA